VFARMKWSLQYIRRKHVNAEIRRMYTFDIDTVKTVEGEVMAKLLLVPPLLPMVAMF